MPVRRGRPGHGPGRSGTGPAAARLRGRDAAPGSGDSPQGRGRLPRPSTSRDGPAGLPRSPSPAEDTEEEASERVRQLKIGDGGDNEHNRSIRRQYRELISSVQQNREEMLSSKSNRLTEALEEADKLFEKVCRAREAALDAQFLVLASNLGKEKANELHSEMTSFDSAMFAEDLLTLMGINRTQVGENDHEPGGFLPHDAWRKVGEEALKYFKRAPTFHYMLGSFKSEPPVAKQRIERQKKASRGEAKQIMPTQLKKMEESHEEATEREVERILGILQTLFESDPDTPISFFDFVIDPNSFARTVENMFHVSFLIRDGLAEVKLDNDKLPIIEPTKSRKVGEINRGPGAREQLVMSLTQEEWKEIIEAFEITEAMISPPFQSTEEEMET
ncbi:non-structural maintenance of chromosomes element 4 homolog A [Empidonax traillii]|uniref:non-structural maintenance of chromosomes element 4 homolog A n=1 Tax=Empidonax traillii TaxID=164674 RepID=UPI000FFD6846|nr:non-structural maintenance of chromosomes element 4 homolog A [Empidonax traillii]XP_027761991.1 non-structural maintenance of chromosomes element 4 homolog A [Empidonax traillii]